MFLLFVWAKSSPKPNFQIFKAQPLLLTPTYRRLSHVLRQAPTISSLFFKRWDLLFKLLLSQAKDANGLTGEVDCSPRHSKIPIHAFMHRLSQHTFWDRRRDRLLHLTAPFITDPQCDRCSVIKRAGRKRCIMLLVVTDCRWRAELWFVDWGGDGITKRVCVVISG